ncbi:MULTISPECIES: hypothetical protein [unclassified Breznakia]|uniref:hypothetical protein n=1 Tax=unclassified Breznakia TaxID=2623764 RepID=UPI0024735E24|nr:MULTISPECIES: hypothetical protein [unclassified Breznakia]MDH6367857.1 Na+/phosphate symporter [Breznakia sp. PH1-1]MDH6404945.1 Na+/phosphate symporter [Breznakia sp. PF1-11]MDH6412660.1 Na+/phosphate symporter [Breznakia sp. PFB1-11]MDH6415037.1 Na+/phosphate symporter [Breznakia sp. PFB1-14]MDH6417331.1 Na+/phosphate symporter [Breznakia sp. PFB1-4]
MSKLLYGGWLHLLLLFITYLATINENPDLKNLGSMIMIIGCILVSILAHLAKIESMLSYKHYENIFNGDSREENEDEESSK